MENSQRGGLRTVLGKVRGVSVWWEMAAEGLARSKDRSSLGAPVEIFGGGCGGGSGAAQRAGTRATGRL